MGAVVLSNPAYSVNLRGLTHTGDKGEESGERRTYFFHNILSKQIGREGPSLYMKIV